MGKRKNITLIGMPGCGKSTLGVILAKAMNYDFLDSDLLIQKKMGINLQEIINQYGNDRFREIEDEVNASIEVKDTVIATGGSVVYGEKAMEHLKNISTVIYLRLSVNEILKRVDNIKTRGISMKPGETLVDLYNKRVPLYEKYADIVVDCNDMNTSQALSAIIEALGNN